MAADKRIFSHKLNILITPEIKAVKANNSVIGTIKSFRLDMPKKAANFGIKGTSHIFSGSVIINKKGTIHISRIKVKPGKPLLIGEVNESIFVGLPGNPVSALVCAHLFL